MSADRLQHLLANPGLEELNVRGGVITAIGGDGRQTRIGSDLTEPELVAIVERLLAAGGGRGE